MVIESLDNRTAFIPRRSIADVCLSSEAFDDYGPEGDSYYGYLGVYPDDGFWRIVEYADDVVFERRARCVTAPSRSNARVQFVCVK